MLLRFSTYIVECADSSFYTGVTSRLEKRIAEHNSEDYPNSYCYTKRPVKLVFECKFRSIRQAIAFEKQIKGWTRAKKIALINGEFDELKKLVECKNDSHFKNKEKP